MGIRASDRYGHSRILFPSKISALCGGQRSITAKPDAAYPLRNRDRDVVASIGPKLEHLISNASKVPEIAGGNNKPNASVYLGEGFDLSCG